MTEQKTLLQCREEIDLAYRQMLNLVSLLKGGDNITMTMSIGCNPDMSYLINETWEAQKVLECKSEVAE